MSKTGLTLSAAPYNPENPAQRSELATKLKEKLGAAGFKLSEDRTRDPGRSYGQGHLGREEVYTFVHRKDPGLEVQVFTSIAGGGEVRSKGADAIRVCLVYKNSAKRSNPESEEARQYDMASGCRVYRTGEIDDIVERTLERARAMYAAANAVERCNYCKAPMALSKAGKKFCSEVCWLKRKAAVESSAKLEAMLRKPENWKYVGAWPEKALTAFIHQHAETFVNLDAPTGEAYAVLEAAATSLENGLSETDMEEWVKDVSLAMEVNAAELGKHPDLFEKEETPVFINWKQATPDDLLAAAKLGKVSEAELEEMQELAEKADWDAEALVAEGVNPQLAKQLASGSILDQIVEADEVNREKRIEDFVKYWREQAEWDIKYNTEEGQDGFEHSVDYLQGEVDPEDAASTALELLEENEYPRFDRVTKDLLIENGIVEDQSVYKAVLFKNSYRGPEHSLASARVGETYQQHDGVEYDEKLAELLSKLTDDDVKKAAEVLDNDSPYMSFGYRAKEVTKKTFERSFDVRIGETEDWYIYLVFDYDELTQRVDDALGVSSTEEDDNGNREVVLEIDKAKLKELGINKSKLFEESPLKIIKLRPSDLAAETAKMNHCVGQKQMGYGKRIREGRIEIWSLRDRNNHPHFTLEVDTSFNTPGANKGVAVKQLKGAGNRTPGYAELAAKAITKPMEVKLWNYIFKTLGVDPKAVRDFHACRIDDGAGTVAASYLPLYSFDEPYVDEKPSRLRKR